MSSSVTFCMKQAFIFKSWIILDKVTSVYSQKIAKNLSKIFLLVPFQIVLFKSCLKNTLFLEHLNSNISGTAWPNLKNKPIKYFWKSFNFDQPPCKSCGIFQSPRDFDFLSWNSRGVKIFNRISRDEALSCL